MYFILFYFVILLILKNKNLVNNNRAKDVQEIILVSPMGVSKLIDMLSDSREVIRNNVSTLYDNFFPHFRPLLSYKPLKTETNKL